MKVKALGILILGLALLSPLAMARNEKHRYENERGAWRRQTQQDSYYYQNARIRRTRQGLPPGLAKRDTLPPGLQKQLRERGSLPPGLQKKVDSGYYDSGNGRGNGHRKHGG